jgi:3-mercaptopyruvate sulfurtransferase SseA
MPHRASVSHFCVLRNHTTTFRVAVLDGGLPAWKAVGGEVDSVPAKEEAMMAATKAAREVQAPNAGG